MDVWDLLRSVYAYTGCLPDRWPNKRFSIGIVLFPVPVRIHFLPPPGVLTHFFNAVLRFPAQLIFGFFGARVINVYITETDQLRDMLKDDPDLRWMLSTTSKFDKEDFATVMNLIKSINRRYED